MPSDGSAVLDVVVVDPEGWSLGGRLHKEGETVSIKASHLAEHVVSGKCVPKAKAEQFKKIRAAQAAANEAAREAVAQAEAEAKRLGEEAVAYATGEGPAPTEGEGGRGKGGK